MQANFDEITLIELERFEKQVQSNIMMNEYIADVENTARNLYTDGMLRDEEEDPIKMFFHTSLKCLVLHNRFTGPSLSNDVNTARIIDYAYCNQVRIARCQDQMIS